MMSKMSEEKQILEEQKKKAESMISQVQAQSVSGESTKATSSEKVSIDKDENLAVGFLK